MLHILYCNYYVVINRNGGYNAGIYCIAVVIILLYILFLWLGMGMLLCISQKRKWVNRGFLHGPALPIYGSGAMVILVSTIGVRDNIALIFLFGMISSTILEFVTGYCMEKMFGVRYWDYSNQH